MVNRLLAFALFSGVMFAGPYTLQLPGEDYISTGPSTLDSQPVLGEWIQNPNDWVEVNWTCVENERYFVNGVPLYNVYDGAPPCSPTPAVIEPPAPPYVPPPAVTSVPEPGYFLLSSVVFAALLTIAARRKL